MAVCPWCSREMTVASSCGVEVLHQHGEPVAMIPWRRGRQRGEGERCHDCGVRPGGFHHLGCDMQRCPLCRRQMMSCGCRFDEDEPDGDDIVASEALHVDEDGNLVERRWVGGQEIIVRYADLPDKDLTIVQGIPCTTALRTVIDIAVETEDAELDRMVADALRRRLFTVEEARARIAEPDMCGRRGAALLERALDRWTERHGR